MAESDLSQRTTLGRIKLKIETAEGRLSAEVTEAKGIALELEKEVRLLRYRLERDDYSAIGNGAINVTGTVRARGMQLDMAVSRMAEIYTTIETLKYLIRG